MFFLLCMAGFTVGYAASEPGGKTTGVPVPVIPAGKGETCVEDIDFMRRNHMDLLKHQRDETVFNGVRTRRHSLKECVSCHVVAGPGNVPVSASSPKHFCRSCHDYAAVNVDCFQCHASRPETGALAELTDRDILSPAATAGTD